jgi:hypothetical protein
VYSLAVTLFALLLGTGIGSLLSRHVPSDRVRGAGVAAIALVAVGTAAASYLVPHIIDLGIPWPLPARIALAAGLMTPAGVLLGIPLPSGMRLLAARRPALIPWGWGMNGAFSVLGATLAIFFAMNWGFAATLLAGAAVYVAAAALLARIGR